MIGEPKKGASLSENRLFRAFDKNKLVVAKPTAAGFQPRQVESPFSIPVEDRFRPRYFEGISAQPIQPVAHPRHPPVLIIGPIL